MSIIKVAELAKVSTATVSRVINQNSKVSPKLKKRVMAAIEILNYHPSTIARSMRNQTSNIIGVVVRSLENPFSTSLVVSIEEEARKEGYFIFLCPSDQDFETEKNYLRVLAQYRVSGAIVMPCYSENMNPLLDFKIPIVLVDSMIQDPMCDSVTIDNEKGGYMGVKYLLEKGHTRIGIITAPDKSLIGSLRYKGCLRALREAGVPINLDLIKSGNYSISGAGKSLKGLLSMTHPPTAVFSLNDTMTMGSIQGISQMGYRIPDDISVLSFDDMPWLSFYNPPISSIEQPIREIGRLATQTLFDRIKNIDKKFPFRNIVLNSSLKEFASVRDMHKASSN